MEQSLTFYPPLVKHESSGVCAACRSCVSVWTTQRLEVMSEYTFNGIGSAKETTNLLHDTTEAKKKLFI